MKVSIEFEADAREIGELMSEADRMLKRDPIDPALKVALVRLLVKYSDIPIADRIKDNYSKIVRMIAAGAGQL